MFNTYLTSLYDRPTADCVPCLRWLSNVQRSVDSLHLIRATWLSCLAPSPRDIHVCRLANLLNQEHPEKMIKNICKNIVWISFYRHELWLRQVFQTLLIEWHWSTKPFVCGLSYESRTNMIDPLSLNIKKKHWTFFQLFFIFYNFYFQLVIVTFCYKNKLVFQAFELSLHLQLPFYESKKSYEP